MDDEKVEVFVCECGGRTWVIEAEGGAGMITCQSCGLIYAVEIVPDSAQFNDFRSEHRA